MDQTHTPVDEYILAAFIAGTLDEERRRAVINYLAANAEARELLHMAYQAMEAAHAPDAVPEVHPAPAQLPVSPVRDRAPRRRIARRMAAGLLAVLLVGFGVRALLFAPSDALRSPQPAAEAPTFSVQIETPSLAMSWDPVLDAYAYQIIIWDPVGVRVVDRHRTTATHLDADDPFVETLSATLEPGHSYSLRVDAINAQNRQLRSSEAINFTFQSQF